MNQENHLKTMNQENTPSEQMNIVIVGHVDHGKSTVIGRLLADTDSLPKGKLEQVKAFCQANARPFEYAFLLDALKDEQAQGITIDSARCFFKTTKRHYIIIDAPGHIEFLKNMISGAARAEAALLVIDAHEGVRENSKRHGHMISMLGIKQLVVVVNKMDLVGYSQERFKSIQEEYTQFLAEIGVKPISFLPICARDGENIAHVSSNMSWYQGHTVLATLDAFHKTPSKTHSPFRMPVQDIYKFTANNDDRRIVAGTIDTGKISVGEAVIFLPSKKEAKISTIEAFNSAPLLTAQAGQASGFTLSEEIYIRPGEIMVKKEENPPHISQRIRVNLFWMSKSPMILNKTYKLKLAAKQSPVILVDILSVLDASTLNRDTQKKQINRHDVAEVILEAPKPLAFDIAGEFENTSRFVLVDNYEISGGGIVLEALNDQETTLTEHIRHREITWKHSNISPVQRSAAYHHKPKFLLIVGENQIKCQEFSMALEKQLFEDRFNVYYLGLNNLLDGMGSDILPQNFNRDEQIRRLGELARILTDAGLIFIASASDLDRYDLRTLKLLNHPHEILVIHLGKNTSQENEADLSLESEHSLPQQIKTVYHLLKQKAVLLEQFL